VDARFNKLVVKVVAFTRTLTDPCEHGVAAVRLSDVVDQFLNENRLANACAAEQTDLAALCVRSEQVNDLDASDQDRSIRRLLDIVGSRRVDRTQFGAAQWAGFVDRLA